MYKFSSRNPCCLRSLGVFFYEKLTLWLDSYALHKHFFLSSQQRRNYVNVRKICITRHKYSSWMYNIWNSKNKGTKEFDKNVLKIWMLLSNARHTNVLIPTFISENVNFMYVFVFHVLGLDVGRSQWSVMIRSKRLRSCANPSMRGRVKGWMHIFYVGPYFHKINEIIVIFQLMMLFIELNTGGSSNSADSNSAVSL